MGADYCKVAAETMLMDQMIVVQTPAAITSLEKRLRHIRHFVDEKQPCGCTVRKWYSGKQETFQDRDCAIKHRPYRFICPNSRCGKEFRSMKALHRHKQEDHAI